MSSTTEPLTYFVEANRYLARFYDNQRTEYKLDNMYALMKFLGNPQEKYRVVHIAGTSGKTSTSYYMAALLTAAGYRTGLTVSPHVDEINERVQINGQPLTEKKFCEALNEFLDILSSSTIDPSWFELMVAFAYWYFAREAVDYVVAEVGLGGLKDATNVISRSDKICVITDIGYDHIQILGKTLPEIAAQKAGIIHKGNQVFTYEQGPEITRLYRETCAEKQAELHIIEPDYRLDSQIPAYQVRNWYLAHKTYLSTDMNSRSLTNQSLLETQLVQVPGRMDIVHSNDKKIIMDGAHNEQKMTAFIDSFQRLYPKQKATILIALREGKESQEVAPLLSRIAEHVIITSFQSIQDMPVKSVDPKILAETFKRTSIKDVEIVEDHNQALDRLLSVTDSIGIITGSLYLINQVRSSGRLAA